MPQLIEIVPPREEWFEDFGTLKQAVMRAAPGGAYIHNIGSTAMPDLPAKDTAPMEEWTQAVSDGAVTAISENIISVQNMLG